jgi:alpha-tubulin suppressor-like RCC1 family protein
MDGSAQGTGARVDPRRVIRHLGRALFVGVDLDGIRRHSRAMTRPHRSSLSLLLLLALSGCGDPAADTDAGPRTDAAPALDAAVDVGPRPDGAIAPDAFESRDADVDAAYVVPPPHASFFTPVATATPVYFAPPAEPPLLGTTLHTDLQRIATSEYHVLFVVGGRLLGIGSNRAGELGQGHAVPTITLQPTPIAVPDGLAFVDASAGGYQSLAIDADGYVWSFGGNQFGQRGDGTMPSAHEIATGTIDDVCGIPVKLTVDADGASLGGASDPIVDVESTLLFDVALSQSGNVYAWGLNGNDGTGENAGGIVGDGNAPASATCTSNLLGPASCYARRPARVRFPTATHVTRISASSQMIGALDDAGQLWVWGGGGGNGLDFGIGDRGAETQSGTPIHVTQGRVSSATTDLTPLPPMAMLTIQIGASLAVDTSGELWGWGLAGPMIGQGGELGAWNPQPRPVKLTHSGNAHYAALDAALDAGHHIVDVRRSLNAAFVLFDDGSLFAWGDAAMGEVGDGHLVNYLMVTDVAGGEHMLHDAWDWGGTRAPVVDAIQILSHVRTLETSAYSFHAMAIRTDGTIFSWGRDANGVRGDGRNTYDYHGPDFAAYEPVADGSYTSDYLDTPYPTWVDLAF